MDLNTVSLIVSILGIVVSVGTTLWSTIQLRRSVGVAFSLDVRRNIERLERNKEKFKQSTPDAYRELYDVQGELETIDSKLTKIFSLKKR
jgi:hypothetical protein